MNYKLPHLSSWTCVPKFLTHSRFIFILLYTGRWKYLSILKLFPALSNTVFLKFIWPFFHLAIIYWEPINTQHHTRHCIRLKEFGEVGRQWRVLSGEMTQFHLYFRTAAGWGFGKQWDRNKEASESIPIVKEKGGRVLTWVVAAGKKRSGHTWDLLGGRTGRSQWRIGCKGEGKGEIEDDSKMTNCPFFEVIHLFNLLLTWSHPCFPS